MQYLQSVFDRFWSKNECVPVSAEYQCFICIFSFAIIDAETNFSGIMLDVATISYNYLEIPSIVDQFFKSFAKTR